jgi:hypothetical protein
MLIAILLNVIMLNVIMLNVIMLSVFMLNVVAPLPLTNIDRKIKLEISIKNFGCFSIKEVGPYLSLYHPNRKVIMSKFSQGPVQ